MAFNNVTEIDNHVKIKTVLMSVSDKTGLAPFVQNLVRINPDVTIYSTGGTFKAVKEALGSGWSKNLEMVSDYTGQPEMQGGLVKTLDFKIYMGILSEKYNRAHNEDMKRINAEAIDMVVVNLYPFKETISKDDVTLEMARGNIDIGGPCMTRASAKNFIRVASVCNPAEYDNLIAEMEKSEGSISVATRYRLATQSFKHTAEYDAAIAGYLADIDFEKDGSIYNWH